MMHHQFPPSSVSAKLVAINSAVVAIRETAAAAEDDPVEQTKRNEKSSNGVKQHDQQFFTKERPDVGILSKDFLKNKGREQLIANSAPSIVQTQSTVKGAPDIGILSKDFLKNKGRERPPVDEQFEIHRKKRAAADVDVGILSKRRWREGQRRASRDNLHAMNEVTGRSLQSEEVLPLMCPGKYGGPGYYYFSNLFNQTDAVFFTEEGYFPKCSCSSVSPTTCGPNLCECLELDADGDILECMDPLNQLCQGTMNIDGIPGPWSMEECLGDKYLASAYCSMLPCFVDGGSYSQCACKRYDSSCTEFRDAWSCAHSKCCQAQTDDEGREACIDGGLHQNYYDETSFSISDEEMISRFNECSFDSSDNKSIVQCYCESFSYGRCVNNGVANPDICEANICCFEQTEDDARLDCFTTRFRHGMTGLDFHSARNELQESCVASGKSSDQCKCDIQGLSNCVYGIHIFNREPRCDLFQCCQSQMDDDDDGRKYCLVQDEAQMRYEECVNDGNTTESCLCDKSNTLCSSGHSNDFQCELSSCCQAQADDTGRKECIGNFTTSQPSSAPSETTPAIPEIKDSPSTVSVHLATR